MMMEYRTPTREIHYLVAAVIKMFLHYRENKHSGPQKIALLY